jgi:hypothetical protein
VLAANDWNLEKWLRSSGFIIIIEGYTVKQGTRAWAGQPKKRVAISFVPSSFLELTIGFSRTEHQVLFHEQFFCGQHEGVITVYI